MLTLQFGQSTPAVISLAYDDDPLMDWPAISDGGGASFVRIAPEDLSRDPNLGINWRSGSPPSPGTDDRIPYTAWFGAPPTGDPDHDGLENLVEYALGTDPLVDSSSAIPTAVFQSFTVSNVTSIYATLNFQRHNLHEDLTQHVEFSTDLATWPITGVQVSATDNGDGTRTELWRSSMPVEANQRLFGRLRFTHP